MSDEMKSCPTCKSPYGYFSGKSLYTCPECLLEWNPEEHDKEEEEENDRFKVLDSNNNPLENGDTVIVIKNLPVKGAPGPIKAGTKVKNIRLREGDHNLSCKIAGFGAMNLKSEFVRKS